MHSNAHALMVCTSASSTGNGVRNMMHHRLMMLYDVVPMHAHLSKYPYVSSGEAVIGEMQCTA